MPTAQKPTDRRITRSKQLLLDALRGRLVEVRYEKVTIQSILDRAGVGRATFYAHFDSKDDLLWSSIGGLHRALRSAGKQSGRTRFGFSLPFFAHLASHRAIYQMSICHDDEITVARMMRRMLRELVRDEVTTRAKPTDAETLTIEFVVGALWSTVVWWMDSGSPISPSEIDAHFRQLMLAALDARS